MATDKPGLLEELKRRHVVRAAIIYAAAVWALAQGISQLSPAFGLSTNVTLWFVIACVIGFPFWIAFAWYFKFTSHGIAREDDAPEDALTARRIGRKLDYWIIGILCLAVVLLLTNELLLQRGKTLHEFAATPAATAVAHASGTKATPPTVATPASATAQATSLIAAQPIPAKSVAVLPLENLSTIKANAYFADGMQDLILTKLADIGDLKVISRTSTEQYGSHPENLTLVGEQLGVATILEGSVQKAGKQVLINVQLIDAKTDSHIWAHSYQRTLTNIFGVEGEVATAVAKALNAKLTASESSAIAQIPTHNQRAYQAFLKAIYYVNDSNRTGNPGELQKSVGLLKQAVAVDPNFADAWSLLALVYDKLGNHYREAERAVLRALALDPNNGAAHTMYAFALMNQGKFKQAIAQAQGAVRLRPKEMGVNAGLGVVYQSAGDLDAAETAYTRCIKLFPHINFCRKNMADVEMQQRRYMEAMATLQYVVDADRADVAAATGLASVYELGWGDLKAARSALQDIATPVASSGQLSEAWYWLDLYTRDYTAALGVIDKTPQTWFMHRRVPKGLYQARVYQAQGDVTNARAALAAARTQLDAWIKATPDDADLHASLALALAGLGERHQALREAQLAPTLESSAGDFGYGRGYRHLILAEVVARIGDPRAVVELLDQLLGQPTGDLVSVHRLQLDPAWDPIRRSQQFQALLKRHAKDEPAVIPASASS